MTQSHRLRSRRHRRSLARAALSLRRRGATRAIRATRSPRRCSPTACIWSGAASSITGRAASSPPAPTSPMRWCSSRAARAPSPTCARRQQELYDGLVAASQNRWPSLRFDIGALNDVAVAAASRPASTTRRSCGRPRPRGGCATSMRSAAPPASAARRASPIPTTTSIATRTATCWSSAAGRRASPRRSCRGACGARVIALRRKPGVRRQPARRPTVDDRRHAGRDWARRAHGELAANGDVTLLPRTTAFGYYDQNLVGLVERVADHLPEPPPIHAAPAAVACSRRRSRARQRRARARHRLRGQRSARHDARRRSADLCQRYGVKPGTRAVVFANNDSAYDSGARACTRRASPSRRSSTRGRKAHSSATIRSARAPPACRYSPAASIVGAHGRLRVAGVDLAPLDGGAATRVDCDLVCVSGGWNPAVHLYSQSRGKLRYDDALATFVPDASPQAIVAAGAANGKFDLSAALADGHAAGLAAAAQSGFAARTAQAAPTTAAVSTGPLAARCGRCRRAAAPSASSTGRTT